MFPLRALAGAPVASDGCPSQEHILELLAVIYDSCSSGLIWIFCPPHPEFCDSVVLCLVVQLEKNESRNVLGNRHTGLNSILLKSPEELDLNFLLSVIRRVELRTLPAAETLRFYLTNSSINGI